MRDFGTAFAVAGGDFRTKCYDFGVDIQLGGYVPISQGQHPLLRETGLIALPRCRKTSKLASEGVGRVASPQEHEREKEWREEWLPNK